MLRVSYDFRDTHYTAYSSFLTGFKVPVHTATEESHNSALAMDLFGPDPVVKEMVRLAKKGTFLWVQPLPEKPGAVRPPGFFVRSAADRVLTVKPRPGYTHVLLISEALLRGNVAWGEAEEEVLYSYLDRTLNIPLPREWLNYLLGKINPQKELIQKVGVYAGNYPVTPWKIVSVGKLQSAAQEALSKGLKTGEIKFPGFSGPAANDPLQEVSGLEDYLTRFGNLLADKIARSHKPLHNPTDPDSPLLQHLLRKPYKAQADAIQGLAKAFQRRKALFLVGEMGTGKTLIASAVPYLLWQRPYRVLVMCPAHLANKWVREIKKTVPGAVVKLINDWEEAIRTWDPTQRPVGREYFVVSKETMKLGYLEHFAGLYYPKRVIAGQLAEQAWVCPACGGILKIPAPPKSKSASNVRCEHCRSPLWTADRKLRKVSVAQIVKRLPSGYFDLAVADEVHESASEMFVN